MSLKSGQSITVDFCTQNTSGAATNADSTPTGTVVVNGTDNGATVTVTNKSTGNYKAAVTLPSLSAGDVVQLRIAATIGSTAAKAVIFQGVADTKRVSDLVDAAAAPSAAAIRTEMDANSTKLANLDAAVSSRSTLTAQQVWEYATRSLTTFGTLVSDIWSSATRTLTAISDSAGVTTLLSRIVGTLAAGTHNAQSGDAYARLGAPAGASIAADVATRAAAATALSTAQWTNDRAAKLDYLDAAISGVGGATGPGAIETTVTLQEADTTPIADAQVWISTDAAGSNVIAGPLTTNASGEATFMLDAGSYYRWAQKNGWNFTNPQSFSVS